MHEQHGRAEPYDADALARVAVGLRRQKAHLVRIRRIRDVHDVHARAGAAAARAFRIPRVEVGVVAEGPHVRDAALFFGELELADERDVAAGGRQVPVGAAVLNASRAHRAVDRIGALWRPRRMMRQGRDRPEHEHAHQRGGQRHRQPHNPS